MPENYRQEMVEKMVAAGMDPHAAREIARRTGVKASAGPDLFGDTPPQANPTAVTKRGRGRPRKAIAEKRSDAAMRELVVASLDIEARAAKEAGALGFMSTIWACATLPHREVYDRVIYEGVFERAVRDGLNEAQARALAELKARVTHFSRSNGLTTLNIQANEQFGLPFGKVPRVVMAWVCTEAKRTKSRVLSLGRSQNEFMRKLGMAPTGGKKGNITALKNQTTRLLFSTIAVLERKGKDQLGWKHLKVSEDGVLLWNPRRPDEQSLWESQFTLSEPFFQRIQESSFPIDLRVVNALRSPLAIDIYLWLTWRVREIRGGQTVVPWEALRLQFGSQYEDSANGFHHFKQEFCRRLGDVLKLYPDAKVAALPMGVRLTESPSHIPVISG